MVDLLQDDPELLRLAAKVAGLADEPHAARSRRRHRVAAAVLACAAGAAAGVVALTGSGSGVGFGGRALAAISADPVLHTLLEQTAASDRTVDLRTGREVRARLTMESWLDEPTGRLHVVERRNRGVIADRLLDAKAASAGATPLDPALALFLTGYRKALRADRASVVGPGVVEGQRVEWLELEGSSHERVAVDARSFLPVLLEAADGTRWVVASIETTSRTDADFRSGSRPSVVASGGSVVRARPGTPADASRFLGTDPLVVGGSPQEVLRLAKVELERVQSTLTGATGTRRRISRGVSLTYRGKGGVEVALQEARLPLPAYGYSGGRTFSFDPIPPEGSMQITSIGSSWLGQLRSHGLYLTITAPDPTILTRVARRLRPANR